MPSETVQFENCNQLELASLQRQDKSRYALLYHLDHPSQTLIAPFPPLLSRAK